MSFVENLIFFVTLQKLWNSVHVWRSSHQLCNVLFFMDQGVCQYDWWSRYCRGVACGEGGAGRTRRHLFARGRQIGENCKKNSREISDCKFHMFASAIKTKSYSQRDRRLYWGFDCVRFDFPKPKTIGRQIWPPH